MVAQKTHHFLRFRWAQKPPQGRKYKKKNTKKKSHFVFFPVIFSFCALYEPNGIANHVAIFLVWTSVYLLSGEAPYPLLGHLFDFGSEAQTLRVLVMTTRPKGRAMKGALTSCGPLNRLNAILSLLQPSAIGRPISYPHAGRTSQPPCSKPSRKRDRAIAVLERQEPLKKQGKR